MTLAVNPFRKSKTRTQLHAAVHQAELGPLLTDAEATALVGAVCKSLEIGVQMPVLAPTFDPYTDHRLREEAFGRERLAALTFEHPDNVRARHVAALRGALSRPFVPRFPPEGRSDRIYRINQKAF